MSELLTFPCDFPIKVFGLSTGDFNQLVFDVVKKHVPDLQEAALANRPSKNGKYLAVTVTIKAESQAQLDKIYMDLSSHTDVVMAL